MKNVAIVIDGLSGGGAEKVMLALAAALIKLGHQVTMLSLSGERDYPIPDGLSLEILFPENRSNLDRFWRLNSSVRLLETWFSERQKLDGRFDLVLSNLDKSNNLLAKSNVQRVFYVIHNSIEQELLRQKKLGPLAYNYLKKSKQNLSDKNLVCVSKGLKQEIIGGTIIQPESIRTIYNPFDRTQVVELSKIHNDAIPRSPYLIHVGRLARQKRHDVLFEAFSQVDDKYKLVLLCNKPDKARKLAQKFGIQDRLILPGFQTNPYNWIKHAQALVLSSDYEGLSMVLLEALAVGTKVVSTRCPHGPSEILTGERSKFLVPVQNSRALASAINEVLKVDFDCKNAEILEKIESEQIARQYLELMDAQN